MDLGTRYDWNWTTVPQKFLDNRPRPYNAGRAVGGGTLLNGMIWTRGTAADYDAWEALGNPGWGWEDMLPYFKKVGSDYSTASRLCLQMTFEEPGVRRLASNAL